MWSNQKSHDQESDFLSNLRRINQFLALFYVPAGLKSSVGVDAPANDLEFLQNKIKCKTEDATIANAAFKKFSTLFRPPRGRR